MKAVLCKKFAPIEDLVVEDVASPKPSKNQIVISVKACGINFPDLLIVKGKYQFKPDFPFSPGGEVAGIVKEVGEGVKHLKVGDSVFAGMVYGGFAEEVVCDAFLAFPIPQDLDFVTASSIMITYGTSYHALVDRAKLKANQTVLVLGAAGGVGLATIGIAKALGAKVIAAASTQEKLSLCKEYGADQVINYTEENLKEKVKDITNKKGVDVIYDPVGGDFSEQALRAIAWEGRYLVIGFAAGKIPEIPLNLTLLKGCQIIGVFWGSFAQRNPQGNMQNFMQILKLFKEGKLKNHIHGTYSLDKAVEAMKELQERRAKGKVVLVT